MGLLAKLGIDSIGEVLKPIAGMVDKIPTGEDKAQALAELRKVEADLQARQEEAAARIIEAEAKSTSKLAQNWRPLVSLQLGSVPTVFVLVGLFKPQALPVIVESLQQVPDNMWTLLTGVLVGYTALRSIFDKQNGQGLSETLSKVWYGKKLGKLQKKGYIED